MMKRIEISNEEFNRIIRRETDTILVHEDEVQGLQHGNGVELVVLTNETPNNKSYKVFSGIVNQVLTDELLKPKHRMLSVEAVTQYSK